MEDLKTRHHLSKKQKASILFAALGFAFTGNAYADTVIVNGTWYVCSSACTITTNSDGTLQVEDCCGGEVNIFDANTMEE